MSNVGNLEVELSLRDEFTIALEKSIASLKRFSAEAEKAADRAEKSFKEKAKAADESARATEKDTKAAKENAQASDAEAKGADATTRGRKAKAKAAAESAQATGADAKATQANAGAADIEAKASEQAATSKRGKKKAAEEAARATGADTAAAQENAKAAEEQAQADKVAAQAKKEAEKAAKESAAAKREEAKAAKETAAATKEAAKAQTQAANEAEKAERAHAAAVNESRQKLRDLQSGLQQAAMQLGVMSAAMLYGAKTSIDAFNELRAAGQGLTTVAQRTGQDVSKVNDAAKALSSDGLMTLKESSTSLKNLLATGFNLDQAVNLINTFRDSAAFGRQSSLQFGEAVQTATEGIKNGNSILVDNAGITKNLSVILREAGKSEQDLQNVQSNTSVRMALYNGILKEGALFQGDAAKAAGELSGKMSATGASAKQLQATIGESLAPAVSGLLDMVRPVLGGLGDWIKANPDLARGLGLVAAGAVTLGAAFTGLAAAAVGLYGMLGPAGWAILGVGLAAGAMAGYLVQVTTTGKAAAVTKDQMTQLVGEYDTLRAKIDDTATSETDRKRAVDELNGVLEELRKINPDIVTGWRLNRDAIDEMNGSLDTAIAKATWWQKLWGGIKGAYGEPQTPADETKQAREELDRLEAQYKKIRLDDAAMAAKGGDKERAAQLLEEADAQTERIWAPKLAAARARLAAAQKVTGGNPAPEEFGQPSGFTNIPKGKPGGGGPPPPPHGGKEMSPELKAALEDLQDIQALEHSPENMARILAKTREIIAIHYDELAKLDKLRDMQRTARITLPNEIAQAEYNAALSLLDSDKTLKGLNPEQFAQGLRSIKDRFTAYLQAHPDQALQMDLRLRGASDEELKAPLDRWREALRRVESAGGFDGTGGQDRKALFLENGLSLALGAGDMGAAAELTGQIKQVEKALSDANFTDKFDRIKKARESAFVSAAGALAQLEMDLMDEEAKGDKANPQRIAALKQQMLDAVKPALEAEKASLEALRAAVLADTTLTEEQRAKRAAEIEQALNGVRQDLYAQDVNTHRIMTEAKVAAEKAAADEKKKVEKKLQDDRKEAQKDALTEIDKAEKTATEQAKKDAKEREDALQGEVNAAEERLKQYDRQIAQGDRLLKIQEAAQRIQDLKHSGEKRMVINADGTQELRTVGMDEANKNLRDAIGDDQKARRREQMQDEIQNLRDRLQALKEADRQREDEIKAHFAAAKDAMQKSFEEMNAEQATGLETMKTALVGQVDSLLGEWSRYAEEAKRLIASIPTAPPPAAGAPATTPSSPANGGGGSGATPDEYRRPGDSKHRAFGTGAYVNRSQVAVVGDRPETIVPDDYLGRMAHIMAPLIDIRPLIIPAGIGGGAGAQGMGGGVTIENFSVSLPSVKDADGFARELPAALKSHGINIEAAFQRGAAKGRTSR